MDADHLATLWAATRDERVLHLARCMTESTSIPPELKGRGKKAHAAWLSMAKEDDTHLPLLLAALTGGTSVQALERLEALQRYHLDCRLRIALERWCVALPYRTPPHANRFWKRALELLSGLVPPQWDSEPLANQVMVANGTSYGAKLAGWLRNIKPTSPSAELRALNEDEEAQLQDALKAHPIAHVPADEKSTEYFLGQIIRDLRDDSPRVVLADLLMEQADPRGEFISLQCFRAKNEATLLADDPLLDNRYSSDSRYKLSEAELELLEKWRGEWLGPWLSTIGRVVFERGFPVLFALDRLANKLGKLVGDPALATVEHIRLDRDKTPPSLSKFLNHPVLGNLRTLDGVTPYALSKLGDERAGKLEAVTVVILESSDVRALVPVLERMPVLKRLRLVGRYSAPAISAEDLKLLVTPEIGIDQGDDTGSLHTLRSALHPQVESFVVHRELGPEVRYHRSRAFQDCELRVSRPWVQFERLLSALPPEGKIHTISAPTMTTIPGDQWGRLGELARVSPQWERVEIRKDIDWSTAPETLPTIRCLKLGYQSEVLSVVNRLAAMPEIISVHDDYNDLHLRRDDGDGWCGVELLFSKWPTEARALALLDAIGEQVQSASWEKDENNSQFLQWASKHKLRID